MDISGTVVEDVVLKYVDIKVKLRKFIFSQVHI